MFGDNGNPDRMGTIGSPSIRRMVHDGFFSRMQHAIRSLSPPECESAHSPGRDRARRDGTGRGSEPAGADDRAGESGRKTSFTATIRPCPVNLIYRPFPTQPAGGALRRFSIVTLRSPVRYPGERIFVTTSITALKALPAGFCCWSPPGCQLRPGYVGCASKRICSTSPLPASGGRRRAY